MYNEFTMSGLNYEKFRSKIDDKDVFLYQLTNENGCELTICNYGARIISLLVPDRNGAMVDVVTGHDSIDSILATNDKYFGVICGRYANRIARGRFELDGKVYDQLAINNGPNNLHGGVKGFNSQVWDAQQVGTDTLILEYISPDGEEGFPGTMHVKVTYKLTNDNSVEISYEATTDRPTVVNLTNHAFFNLSGDFDKTVADHILTIHASQYLPTDNTAIPYGNPAPVAGTPMAFDTPFTPLNTFLPTIQRYHTATRLRSPTLRWTLQHHTLLENELTKNSSNSSSVTDMTIATYWTKRTPYMPKVLIAYHLAPVLL